MFEASLVPLRDLNRSCPLKFVHSAFHGVGHFYVQQAFRAFGFSPPIPVPEQKDPDPNFSSVRCPNPEEGESVLVKHGMQNSQIYPSLPLISVSVTIVLCCAGARSSAGGEGKCSDCYGNRS